MALPKPHFSSYQAVAMGADGDKSIFIRLRMIWEDADETAYSWLLYVAAMPKYAR